MAGNQDHHAANGQERGELFSRTGVNTEGVWRRTGAEDCGIGDHCHAGIGPESHTGGRDHASGRNTCADPISVVAVAAIPAFVGAADASASVARKLIPRTAPLLLWAIRAPADRIFRLLRF